MVRCGAAAVRTFVTTLWSGSCRCSAEHSYFLCARFLPLPLPLNHRTSGFLQSSAVERLLDSHRFVSSTRSTSWTATVMSSIDSIPQGFLARVQEQTLCLLIPRQRSAIMTGRIYYAYRFIPGRQKQNVLKVRVVDQCLVSDTEVHQLYIIYLIDS